MNKIILVMAPLKFEDNIKDKLKDRTITPSKDAWSKLSSELDKEDKEAGSSSKLWLYAIAASIVGFFAVTSLIYTNKDVPVIKNEMVEVSDPELIQEKKNQQTIDKLEPKVEIEDPVVKENVRTDVATTVKKQNTKAAKQPEINTAEDLPSMEIRVANTVIEQAEIIKEESKDPFKVQIEHKVAGVIAQVEEMEKNNIQVTDEEINRLLQEAQREITTERILNTNKVSATALLQDVESELDETFKQRVFEALKAGFIKVKEAVAERNQ